MKVLLPPALSYFSVIWDLWQPLYLKSEQGWEPGKERENSHMPPTIALLEEEDDPACVPFGKVHAESKCHRYGFFQLPEPHLQELLSSWEVIEK